MSSQSMPSKVIIAGAGLAGPALAIALARHSIKSVILERRPGIEDIGGVIMLAPNAMRVMDSTLDIDAKIREKASEFEAIHIHVQSGDSLLHVGGFGQGGIGIRGVTIARPTLHEILVNEAKSKSDMVELRYDARLEKVEEDEKGVTVILNNGDKVQGDLLIGCDGIGSDVRKHVLGDRNPKPIYSGLVFIGSILESSKVNLPPSYQLPSFCYNPRGAFLSFAMDNKKSAMQWATSLTMPEKDRKTGWKEYAESGEAVEDLKKEYQDCTVQPIRSFVDILSKENIKLWAPYMLPDLPTWHTKRVCVLGDAAHAIPPSVGQGSAMAFEDVALLSRLLTSPKAVGMGYDNLFEFFEKTRKRRVDKIRKAAMNAEGTRRPTSNGFIWWAKTVGVRAVMWAFGKDGYLTGSDMVTYDVTKESLDVRSVIVS